MMIGIGSLTAFTAWTMLIKLVDVEAAGVNGTKIGFAAINLWFHKITGVHMTIYTITDWLGLLPVLICLCFGVYGAVQLIKRKKLLLVDPDIVLLGVYYIIVIAAYLFFEMVPINYRPILIDGMQEASYPSSTTLLVLSVMPTLIFQVARRSKSPVLRKATTLFAILFSSFMVVGRLIAGVHWATDIIGSVLLSAGLYNLYRYSVALVDKKHQKLQGITEWNSMKNCKN